MIKPEQASINLTDMLENLVSQYALDELRQEEQRAIEAVDLLANLTDEEILKVYDSWEDYNNDYFNQLEIVEWFDYNSDLIEELYNMNNHFGG